MANWGKKANNKKNCKTTANGLTTIWLHDLLTITGLLAVTAPIVVNCWSTKAATSQAVGSYIIKRMVGGTRRQYLKDTSGSPTLSLSLSLCVYLTDVCQFEGITFALPLGGWDWDWGPKNNNQEPFQMAPTKKKIGKNVPTNGWQVGGDNILYSVCLEKLIAGIKSEIQPWLWAYRK